MKKPEDMNIWSAEVVALAAERIRIYNKYGYYKESRKLIFTI